MDPSATPDTHDRVIAVLTEIVNGSISPYTGARQLWTDYYSNDPEQIPELVTFVNDATDYEELPDRREEIRNHIVSEAQRLLAVWS
jgi:hypothetical protein